MKKRIAALLLSLLMATALFAGCSSSNESSESSSDNSGSSQADSGEPVELIWYQMGAEQNADAEVFAKLNELSKEALNTTVDFRYADDQKAKLIVSTNDKYDMIGTCTWHNDYFSNASKGYFADLTDIIPEAAPDLWEFIPEMVWEGSKVNGKIYAIPSYKDSAATMCWVTYQDIIDAGVITMEEFEATNSDPASITPLLAKLQAWIDENGPTASGATNAWMMSSFGTMWTQEYEYITRNAGGIVLPYDTKDNKVYHLFEAPGFVEKQKILTDWYNAGYINKDATTNDQAAQGPIGCTQVWPTNVATNPYYGKELYNIKNMPVFATDFIASAMQGISPNSSNIEAAVKYLEYANLNEEYRNIFAYGIEGKHWNKLPEGNIEKTEEGLANYSPWAWAQGTFFTMYAVEPSPADGWKQLETFMETEGTSSKLLGFIPDISEYETELATMSNIYEKYKGAVGCPFDGNLDANIEACMDELYGAGLQKVLDGIQAQVDEFIASKESK